MRIVYVQADAGLARSAIAAFRSHLFSVDQLDVARLLEVARDVHCDVLVLDLNRSPGMGFSLLRRVRELGVRAPIVAFNGCYTPSDRVRLLEAGADDCLPDPVSLEELVARTRVGDLELDYANWQVTRNGKRIRLKPKEFAILEYLMRNAGRPVTRSMIVEHVWSERFEGLTNVVDVHINHLRSKIDRGSKANLIRTAYGIGYELVDPDKKESA